MVILLLMTMKFKRKRTLRATGVVIFLSLFVMLYLLSLGGDYLLNKTIREITLRLTQVEVISRTTAVDYRIIFKKDHYVIDRMDRDTGSWKRYMEFGYPDKVWSVSEETELIFSGGLFREFILKDQTEPFQRYVTVDFAHPGSSRINGFVFFRRGIWRVRV